MTNREDGAWRNEEKTSVQDLREAMASWDTDGQGDPAGNDAGQERALATDPDRNNRPSTTGQSGPN